MVYVHYGFRIFNPELFIPVRNCPWKPKPDDGTGLWACREGDTQGWREWCSNTEFASYDDDDCFRFTLASGAKVLELNDPVQLRELPRAQVMPELKNLVNLISDWVMLDYVKLAADGYDAIELTDWYELRHQLALWDCNCLFVMNPEVIVPLESGDNHRES